jgi:hypothetical protein
MATKEIGTESSTDVSTDDYQDRVAKRAKYEAFEYELGGPGHLKVRNLSYGEDAAEDHTYIVAIEDREAVDCTCPADEYRSGPCKHRVAIEGNEALLSAGSADVEAIEEARQ